jgi:hypothetical protein
MYPVTLIAALLLAAPPVPAALPDGAAGFEKLKKLEGSWKTDAKAGPVQYVTLRLIGAGSSLLETSTGADRSTVNAAAVYTFEGQKLVVTHYGGGGTSRLELAAGGDANTVRFEGASKDARVSGLVMTLTATRLVQEWMVREGGREVKKTLELQREYLDTLK